MKYSLPLICLAMLTMVSCMSVRGDAVPPSSERTYIMRLANDTNYTTLWYIPEHSDKNCPKTGANPLPADKPSKNEFIELAPKTYHDIYVEMESGISCVTDSYCADDAVSIYVFDQEVLGTTEWSDIVTKEKWLERFTLTVEQLSSLSGRVVKFSE